MIYTGQIHGDDLYTFTDDEAAVYFPPQLIFTADRLQVPADGQTVVTIDIQLMSVPLSDGTRRMVNETRTHIGLIVDGERTEIDLDGNGHARLEYAFDIAGDYDFTTDGIVYSPGITIKAV